jgi:hypothetical protein
MRVGDKFAKISFAFVLSSVGEELELFEEEEEEEMFDVV